MPKVIVMFCCCLSLLLSACGGSGVTPGSTIINSNATGLANTSSGSNVMSVVVDGGVPSLVQQNSNFPVYLNGLFTSVKVCLPNSSQCQVIDHVLVDTGSVGLRLLSSSNGAGGELNLPLPAVTDGTSSVYECTQFADGYSWGSVNRADVVLGGETAASVPVQVIGVNTGLIPGNCSNNSTNNTAENTLSTLQANGILGVGVFAEDCGPYGCTPNPYYDCSDVLCTTPLQTLPVSSQVSNPVNMLAQDNNGVLIQLPAIAATGASSVSGEMLLGVNTQANNTLPSGTQVLTLDPGSGQLASATATGSSSTYTTAYTDSGTSVYELGTSLMPPCPQSSAGYGFSCPASTLNPVVTVTDTSAQKASFAILLANASNLFNAAPNMAAFDDLAAPAPNDSTLVLGLPFFFGRSVASIINNNGNFVYAGRSYSGPLVAF